MPLVAGLRPSMPKLIPIAITEAAPVIEPNRAADDLNGEAVICLPVDGWCVHAPSMAHPVSARQAPQQVDKAEKKKLVVRLWNLWATRNVVQALWTTREALQPVGRVVRRRTRVTASVSER